MSGTSLDAVDAALVEIVLSREPPVKLIAYHETEISHELRGRIQTAMHPRRSSVDLICQLNVELGELYAEAVCHVAKKGGVSLDGIDFIGSHGQTIYHIPHPQLERDWKTASTLQIGEPCIIAERTGITTVADFRLRDMAAGGVGAPLIPFVDAFLFADPQRDVLCQNIGGIANCTLIRRDGRILAFDSGPGNMVMDLLVRRFRPDLRCDVDGRLARRGQVLDYLLTEALAHPFFAQSPPKATGHETFGGEFVDWFVRASRDAAIEDLIATAAELTAGSISDAYRKWIFPSATPTEVIVSGGGVKNSFLMELLRNRCPEVRWRKIDEWGIPSDAKEAMGFSVLGYATLCGIPANVPGATGANHAVVLGKIIPGRRIDKLRSFPAALEQLY